MLEIRNLSFEVEGKKILNDISLRFTENAFTVITGPNGGGKSTLAKLIMGIEKPTAGAILLDGKDITACSVDERARLGIGYAFQQPPRFKGMSVRRLLELAHGRPLEEENCISYLSDVGLCSRDYLDRDVDASLSGGEVKRIEIATLLARELKVSIFDEPEAGIDLWSFNNLIQVFEKLHEDVHGSILIISHQERILNIADRIVVIADGRISKTGTKDEILPELLCEPGSCKFYKGEK